MEDDKLLRRFYVYSYSTEKDGIFYIGKGTGRRIFKTHKDCPLCHNILEKRKKQSIVVEKKKIYENLAEQEAFAWEKYLIDFYKPCGNLSKGGEGNSLPGIFNPMYGKKHTKNTKKKISKNKKEYWESEEGKYYKKKFSKSYRGEQGVLAKLDWDKVKQIRKEYSEAKISYEKMAKKFNVKKGAIQKIIENKTWVDQNYIYIPRGYKCENNSNAKLTWEQVLEIRELKKKNFKNIELACMYKVQPAAIGKIVNNKTWKKGAKHE